jgi:adenylate cyclase
LLDPKEVEVTVLFCDVRGFSGVSEKQGPAGTLRWIGDVLSELSDCVLKHGGVLVDYVGDELLAMFGAPCEQVDQATRGVRAGLAMLAALAALNGRWQTTLGGPMDLGIGVNTGPAVVGNSGSRFKFKYGPLGNTVNVGSRVQGLTKYLKCRLLVTEATRRQLGGEFVARRVCRTLVKGILQPVNLYEVDLTSSGRVEFFRLSEEALDLFEKKQFAQSARRAGELLLMHDGDGPLQLLLTRAAQMLVQGGAGFDPVWDPPGK